MPKISEIRIAQYVKAAFNVLEENGDSLRARDVLAAVSERLDLTDYELGRYEKSKNVRWESTLSFWSISPVKAGWLVKQKGTDCHKRPGFQASSWSSIQLRYISSGLAPRSIKAGAISTLFSATAECLNTNYIKLN